MSVTTVRLLPDVEQSLETMSGKLSRSKNWLINEAIREYVRRQEQQETRWAETLQAMESVAQGKVVSGEAVHAWIQSWGSANELPQPKTGQ